MVVFSAVDSDGSLRTGIESEMFSLHIAKFIMLDMMNHPVVI